MSRRFSLILSIFIVFNTMIHAQERMSREEYVETFAPMAMGNMKKTGIPASITLAQGCLESDNGNSRLTREANNHFGIKCHDWTGRKIYHDDDEKNECFRRYKNARHSFDDHSEFLSNTKRYAFLFELKPDDYKGWAKGLKQAGYATSSKYASMLIRIIEENELYKYDEMVLKGKFDGDQGTAVVIAEEGREVLQNNRSEYIVAEQGDTPSSLREELDLYPFEIYRYNNIERGAKLDPGMIIYLQPKRFRAEKGNNIHIVKEKETMWDISQMYGVKLQRLYRMNRIDKDEELSPGTEIWLRKSKPRGEEVIEKKQPVEEEEQDGDMQFEFDGV